MCVGEVDGAARGRGQSVGGGTVARREAGRNDGGADTEEGSEEESSAGSAGPRGGPGQCGAGWWGEACGR